jgi:hypothetical protein
MPGPKRGVNGEDEYKLQCATWPRLQHRQDKKGAMMELIFVDTNHFLYSGLSGTNPNELSCNPSTPP